MSKFASNIKNRLNEIEKLFDAERLNVETEDSDEYDEDEIVSACHNDFKLLVNTRDKMFDIERFEFLINEYANKSTSLKIMIDKVIAAFRTTSYATKEILSPSELVISHSFLSFLFKILILHSVLC